jgi:hypothetical protein
VRNPPPIHRGNICISIVIGFIPVFAEAAAIAIYVFFSTPLLPDRAVAAAAVVLGQISPPQALVMGQPRPECDWSWSATGDVFYLGALVFCTHFAKPLAAYSWLETAMSIVMCANAVGVVNKF